MEKTRLVEADIVGLSALLTTTMPVDACSPDAASAVDLAKSLL